MVRGGFERFEVCPAEKRPVYTLLLEYTHIEKNGECFELIEGMRSLAFIAAHTNAMIRARRHTDIYRNAGAQVASGRHACWALSEQMSAQ